MELSSLILELQKILSDKGDMPVYTYDDEFCKTREPVVTVCDLVTTDDWKDIERVHVRIDCGQFIKD